MCAVCRTLKAADAGRPWSALLCAIGPAQLRLAFGEVTLSTDPLNRVNIYDSMNGKLAGGRAEARWQERGLAACPGTDRGPNPEGCIAAERTG